MSDPVRPDDRRAQHVAAMGFLLQLASYGTLLGISVWSQSDAIAASSRFILAGIPIWVVLFLIFKQLRRVRGEQLETVELRRARESGESAALFEFDDEAMLLEQNRLRWMVRYLLPSVTVLMALLLLAGTFFGWGWAIRDAFKPAVEGGVKRAENPILMMWFVVGVGFLCFLFARYAIALSRLPDWRLLHAGATYMAGNALVCLGLAIALMTATIEWAQPVLAYAVRSAMIVLGLELTVNFVLDFYRPRQSGVVSRPSFDSRLLGLISDPGGIAKSIAEAVNYQFGFEVSSTWFYQLLQRWMFPIVVVTGVVICGLTSVVVVDADEEVVVERFGQLPKGRAEALAAGIHFKWPYPIEKVYRAPVRRISELVIGEATEEEDHEHGQERAVVWTSAHKYVPELMMLVASPKTSEARALESGAGERIGATRSVAVNLLMLSVPIEYRIKNIGQFLYTYAEPVKLMEAVAYQYLSDYAAGVDLDELMGPGRETFNGEIQRRIQTRLDALHVGIEIVFVGIRDAHPTDRDGVAAAFQSAISAQTRMLAMINSAEGESRKMLTAVAGTESRARALDDAIRAKERLQAQPAVDARALKEASNRVEDLLMGNSARGIPPPSGESAAVVADARARASRLISKAAAKARAFGTEVSAFKTAEALYKQRRILDVFGELDDIRKYVILGDSSNVIIEYETAREGGLDQVLREGVEKERSKRNTP